MKQLELACHKNSGTEVEGASLEDLKATRQLQHQHLCYCSKEPPSLSGAQAQVWPLLDLT